MILSITSLKVTGASADGQPQPSAGINVNAARKPAVCHLVVLACYLAAGIVVTWPRATYLADGKLPATRDAGSYVWDLWWMARQVEHLANPWFTRSIAAPAGAGLGYHALMPLEGVLMTPVTLAFGASASYNLLSVLMPGLLCYALYRVGLLWRLSQPAAIAAGGFFGLSSMLTWHAWYQLNLAAGVLFLPVALEAAVRLRRRPGWRQAVLLGVILGASLLTDQESAVLAGILVIAVLLPWVAGHPARPQSPAVRPAAGSPARRRKLAVTAAAVAVASVVASPQIAAIVAQARTGGASFPMQEIGRDYLAYSARFPSLFGVSPRAAQLGLTALRPLSYPGPISDGIPAFGLVLTLLAVGGLAVSWHRRSARMLALLWLGSAALALGPIVQTGTGSYAPAAGMWQGIRMSPLLPYTWFVQIPGLAGFREPARIMMLAIVPAALLAGAAVEWLRRHAAALIVPVLILGALEAGWGGTPGVATMPAALPALDGPIAADHSASIVVDVPFGIRGGIPLPGEGAAFDPEAQVLATTDGHPRAVAYLSRIPAPTLAAIQRHPFYDGLLSAQYQPSIISGWLAQCGSSPALLAAARMDARRMNIGWIIVWHQSPAIRLYLARTGFRFAYAADGALVYRPSRTTQPVTGSLRSLPSAISPCSSSLYR